MSTDNDTERMGITVQQVQAEIEAAPVAAPEGVPLTATGTVESNGPKKRGRKPYPRDANGNIIRPDGSVSKPSGAVRHVPAKQTEDSIATDENIGEAIGAAFALVSIPLGPHWRLFLQEKHKAGQVLGPLVRLYGEDAVLKKVIPIIMTIPVATDLIMPRIAVQRMIMSVEGKEREDMKAQARAMLLRVKAYAAAEGMLDIDDQTKEALEYEKQVVQQGIDMAKEQRKKGTGIA